MAGATEPPADPVVRKLRATAAAHVRHGNLAEAARSRGELGVIRLDREIRRVIAATPLTDDQRDRLMLLLFPAGGGADAA